MKFSYWAVPYSAYYIWKNLCDEGKYNTVTTSVFQDYLPSQFLAKCMPSTVIMASASTGNRSVYCINPRRVDAPKGELDQEPFICVFNHDTCSAEGGIIHHGNWPRRTSKMSPTLVHAVSASGIVEHLPLETYPYPPSGYLSQLKSSPDHDAYWASLGVYSSQR